MKFPTLSSITRSYIRRFWSKEDHSILQFVLKLKDSALPQELKKYLYMYAESLRGLPDYRDDITEHFSLNVYYSDQTKMRVAEKYEFSHQSPSKNGKYTRVVKKCKKSKWKGYQDKKGRTLIQKNFCTQTKQIFMKQCHGILLLTTPNGLSTRLIGFALIMSHQIKSKTRFSKQ